MSIERPEIPDVARGGDATSPTMVTPNLLRSWPLPEPTGTKYSRGQCLVIGGDRSTPGAAMLAGQAALRVGSGRLTLAVAASIAPHVAVAVPESGTTDLPDDDAGAVTGDGAGAVLERDLGRSDAVLLGPGISSAEGAERLLAETIDALGDEVPLVLDAFGATVLAQMSKTRLDALRGRLVLTPNQGELAYLVEADELGDDDVLDATADAAARYDAAVGCANWVVSDGAVWQMTTGDTGLGTSGSGDVMAGAVAGLLSRGAGLAQALVWGKHVHAAAGDVLAAEHGRVGFLAGEIPPRLPMALATLRGD